MHAVEECCIPREKEAVLTVACVLRSGGSYTAEWVGKLSRGVARHLTLPYKFICLTNMERDVEAAGVDAVTLPDPWPGWWSKISLWNPAVGLTGPTFYVDLDTLIVGSLDAIAAYPHRFTMTHEFYRPERMCSTAMAWSGDWSEIWQQMKADPAAVIAAYDRPRKDKRIGDQAFIEDCLSGSKIDTFRDLFGETSIASYKVHCKRGIPSGAAAVSFHGRPKMPAAGGWAQKMWEAA